MAYEIQFTVRAKAHLKALRKRDQKIIIDAVEEQLGFEAETPTRWRPGSYESVIFEYSMMWTKKA